MTDREMLAAAGIVCAGVVDEILRPLTEVRDALGEMVDVLDRHVSEAKGPTPLSWGAVKQLRAKLMDGYLVSRAATQQFVELSTALDVPGHDDAVDLSAVVEAAVALTRHRIWTGCELLIDLCTCPPVRGRAGPLALAVAELLVIASESTRGVEGAAISVKTRRESESRVVLSVFDNGHGSPEHAASAGAWILRMALEHGGNYAGRSETGSGSGFELFMKVASH